MSVMSDSVRPHRQQPTRLLCPWDSPGKNTGVGCHFLLQCMKVKSESEVAQSVWLLATSWTAAYQASLSMGFSRQEYWSRGAIAFSDTVLSSWPQTENNLSNKQKGISHSDIYLHYRSLSSYKSDSYKDYVEIWNNYDIILNREIVSIYWMFTMSLSFCYSIYIHYLFLCSQNLISR